MRETIGKHRAKMKYHRVKGKTKVIPKVKICQRCKIRRVKFHHYLCNNCHLETNGEIQ